MKDLDPYQVLNILAQHPDPIVKAAVENAVLVAQNQMLMATLAEIQPDLFEEGETDATVDSELPDSDGDRPGDS